jgi:hypothetical protein
LILVKGLFGSAASVEVNVSCLFVDEMRHVCFAGDCESAWLVWPPSFCCVCYKGKRKERVKKKSIGNNNNDACGQP